MVFPAEAQCKERLSNSWSIAELKLAVPCYTLPVFRTSSRCGNWETANYFGVPGEVVRVQPTPL